MAETPHSSPNEALLREVDDAVRQDQLRGFWTRYGWLLVSVIVIGLLAFGGWLYWEHHRKQVSGEMAETAYDTLETMANGGAADAAKLEQMSKADQPGYRAMALLAKAGQVAKTGDAKTAAKLYADIAANQELAQPYRDLGTIRSVELNFEQMKPQEIVDRLKPLAVDGGPWFGSAGEMTAIAYMKMGKKNLAGPIFAAIARDEKAPQTLRSRARQMAGLLGVDAVDTEDAAQTNEKQTESEGTNE